LGQSHNFYLSKKKAFNQVCPVLFFKRDGADQFKAPDRKSQPDPPQTVGQTDWFVLPHLVTKQWVIS
jgi:hypothetical protein